MNAPDKTVANPLLQPWTAPHGLPPFDAIEPEHFAPAFEVAMREHRAELDATTRRPGSMRAVG
jgi:peptidyl-dipeptidase Dcp